MTSIPVILRAVEPPDTKSIRENKPSNTASNLTIAIRKHLCGLGKGNIAITSGTRQGDDVQFEKRKFVNKADIAKGIKRHIKSSKKEGGGVYRMDYKGTELDLRLRKVHKDKLARLDSGLYFACTDFDGSDGNTYDVDFFLRGIPEAMEVTEKAVHKINGSPLYTWRQKPDGKWVKLWSAPSAPVHRSLLFRR